VRLPDELTVMGEIHTVAPNVSHVVKAIGTRRFMHEAYTELPENVDAAEDVVAALGARAEHFNPKFGVAPGGQARHYAEDFYPKIMRGLTGIEVVSHKVYGGDSATPLLRMAILDAKRLVIDDPEAEVPEHFRTYAANRELFDATAEHLANDASSTSPLSLRMVNDRSNRLYEDFVAEFSRYAYEQIAAREARMPMKDKLAFARKYDPTKGNYNNPAMMKAERARDLSMYQHIKAAKAQGYVLYGLGAEHEKRLAALLDQEGIKHTTVKAFITAQSAAHPQR
jgi:hypothetical protein